MKRLTALTLALVMALCCTLCLFSCGNDAEIAKQIPGTYVMTSISGQLTQGSVTVDLEEDMYDYYKITFNEDGTALVESASYGVEYEADGTWKYEGGKLKLVSETQGIKVTEAMDWKDGTITFKTVQQAQGVKISMEIILKKQ